MKKLKKKKIEQNFYTELKDWNWNPFTKFKKLKKNSWKIKKLQNLLHLANKLKIISF